MDYFFFKESEFWLDLDGILLMLSLLVLCSDHLPVLIETSDISVLDPSSGIISFYLKREQCCSFWHVQIPTELHISSNIQYLFGYILLIKIQLWWKMYRIVLYFLSICLFILKNADIYSRKPYCSKTAFIIIFLLLMLWKIGRQTLSTKT